MQESTVNVGVVNVSGISAPATPLYPLSRREMVRSILDSDSCDLLGLVETHCTALGKSLFALESKDFRVHWGRPCGSAPARSS